jgi:hypothetical protein
LVSFVTLGITRITWPWSLDFVEGINLNSVLHLADGGNIYRHNGPDGFLSAPYTPLFYLLNVPFAWLSGSSLASGRTISFVATIIIAVLLGYVVWRATRLVIPAILSGVLWISLGPTIVWSAFYKQDIPAVMLDLAGLAVVASNPTGRRIYIGAVLFALAFYTKQSAISAAAATGIWLLLRDWRLGLRFALALGGMVLVPFFVGNLASRGGLWEHLVEYHALPHSERRWRRAVGRLMGEFWPLLTIYGVALIGLAAALWRRNGRLRDRLSTLWTPVVLYTLLGWASTLSKLGYEGANYNHLLDGLLPTCLLVGLLLAALWRGMANNGRWAIGKTSRIAPHIRVWSAVALWGVGALLVAQALVMAEPQEWYRGGWPSRERDYDMRGMSELVGRTPGDIYSEDAHLLLINGKRVIYDDASTFVPMARIGTWDDSLFVQQIRDRRFSLMIFQVGSSRLTDAGVEAFGANYRLKFPGGLEAYEPKVHPDSPQYSLDCTLSRGPDEISLRGYSLAPGVAQNGLKPGEVLRATYYWQPEKQVRESYASYLHVLNEQNEKVIGADNARTGAQMPTERWESGKVITDTTAIPLPNDLAPGRYRLIAGMYLPTTGGLVGLGLACNKGERFGDSVSLGWIEVKKDD